MSGESVELLRSLGSLAEERETRAFVVGGIVRDLFLGRPGEDLDIVVEEGAIEFAAEAVARLGGSAKAHTRFGTVILVLPSGRKIDVATARSEVYERPGALPRVAAGGIVQDLRRRDFTINSMAVLLNPSGFGELLDECGGREDIRNRVLRVITERSFEDDPTRILRGIRFSARFDMRFEETTERLLRSAVDERRTDTVSGERLMNELVLIVREGDPTEPVRLLADWGVLRSIARGWDPDRSVSDTLAAVLETIECASDRDIRRKADRTHALLLTLTEPSPREVRERVVERLSAGRRLRGLVEQLSALQGGVTETLATREDLARSEIYRMLWRLAPETVAVAAATAENGRALRRIELYARELWDEHTAVSGGMLHELGLPQSEALGRLLDAILDARLDGLVSTLDEELVLARRLAPTLTRGERTDNVSRPDDG
jgi:tRNA nucleotidyltransferase (CCA-adding enzyme)